MKKKIVALILVLAILIVLAAGGFAAWYFFLRNVDDGEVNGVEIFKQLYSVSEPTKVVENQTITLESVTLRGGSTLATGALSDGSTATVYTYNYEVLQSVQAGAGDVITPIVGEPESGSREYVEGMGVRYDGGAWDSEGKNFAPTAGSIAINLDETKLKNCTYATDGELQTLSFIVEAKNVNSVFGSDASEIKSDVSVVITANTAVVTGITITYSEEIVPEDEDIAYPEANVTISTVYTYGIESITLVK
jgi:hypothetical protein